MNKGLFPRYASGIIILLLSLTFVLSSCASGLARPSVAEGLFEKVSYDSQTTGTSRNCWVWVPAGTADGAALPVLFALHGIGGTEDEWVDNIQPQRILDRMVADGAITPMIVVFPNGRAMADDSVPSDVYGEEAVAAFANFENDLLNDLIPFIEDNFPAASDRLNRAV
ncbi:MAG: hypothetical protein JXB03_02810 [Spirochaetales bacterium]|nr:hypothetical protein [Spirochaetales bacterium]